MSLYNMVSGFNPYAPYCFETLKLTPDDFARFRDAYFLKENDVWKIGIYARVGGGNRESYPEVFDRMGHHADFEREFDDDFDSTYAHFIFHPKLEEEVLETLNKNEAKITASHPQKKFQAALDSLKGPS